MLANLLFAHFHQKGLRHACKDGPRQKGHEISPPVQRHYFPGIGHATFYAPVFIE